MTAESPVSNRSRRGLRLRVAKFRATTGVHAAEPASRREFGFSVMMKLTK